MRLLSLLLQPERILIILIAMLLVIGFIMQYSAGGGNFFLYSLPFLIKATLAIIVCIIVSRIDLKIVYLLADIFFVILCFALVAVEFFGSVKLGAKRWLDFGFFSFQPSELMKLALILFLAKNFQNLDSNQSKNITTYIFPFIVIAIPFILILRQPDLGTSIIFMFIASILFYISGFRMKYVFIVSGIFLLLSPLIWSNIKPYQKQRILTFLDPEKDPKGSGYHTIQSKIAIGSGGLTGKGLLSGTQSQLDFLPEKHSDFIFTLVAEEFGLIGVSLIILIFGLVIITTHIIGISCAYNFGKYLVFGLNSMFFIYVAVNIAMISGLLPIVGVPLPILSYGGSHLITSFIGFGLILNVARNKNYI